jgi:hypothetical protein
LGSTPRQLQWRRAPDGEMTVWLDGDELIRVVDRGIQQRFRGVHIVNDGGDYTLRRIVLYSTPV